LMQSPAGEVNDVLNDIRTIIQDDAALESGISPALAQYNLDQYTMVDVPGSNEPGMICKASQSSNDPTRFINPRTRQSFAFDHVHKRVRLSLFHCLKT